jgi:hypothetical protein
MESFNRGGKNLNIESKLGHNSPLYERSDETSSEKLLNQVEFMFKKFYVHQQTNTNVLSSSSCPYRSVRLM